MTTKRQLKKRKRESRNRLRRLVATPDSELSESQRLKKYLHLAIQHSLLFGDATLEAPCTRSCTSSPGSFSSLPSSGFAVG